MNFFIKGSGGSRGGGAPLSQGLDDHPHPQSEGHYPPLKSMKFLLKAVGLQTVSQKREKAC